MLIADGTNYTQVSMYQHVCKHARTSNINGVHQASNMHARCCRVHISCKSRAPHGLSPLVATTKLLTLSVVLQHAPGWAHTVYFRLAEIMIIAFPLDNTCHILLPGITQVKPLGFKKLSYYENQKHSIML